MFRAVIISILFIISLNIRAQHTDTLSYAEQLAALEAEMDSLSIFNLIESVLAYDATPSSELHLHLGFTSSVTSAGRDYDINQQGFSPGVSYFHKSGAFANVTGYWNSDVEPNYNPTVFSLGYLGSLSDPWSYSLDYERWLFNPKDTSDNPLTNSIGASINRDLKKINVGLDYSFLFGDKTAHRIIGNLSSTINLGKWWVFDDVRLYPSANILFGNGEITQLRITQEQQNVELRNQLDRLLEFSELTDVQRDALINSVENAYENGSITERRRDRLISQIETAQNLSEEDIQTYQDILAEDSTSYETGNAFGLMNYAFSLPVSLSAGNFSFLLSYSYSVPVSLPNEAFELDPVGFFSGSVSYRIPFK